MDYPINIIQFIIISELINTINIKQIMKIIHFTNIYWNVIIKVLGIQSKLGLTSRNINNCTSPQNRIKITVRIYIYFFISVS